jgi:cytochrome P450
VTVTALGRGRAAASWQGTPPAAAVMKSVAAAIELPLDEYRQARATRPVAFDPQFNQWSVYRYADALRILDDPGVFSSQARGGGNLALPSIVGMDGARHRKLRSLVTLAFTPRMVEQLAPRITAVAGELLEAGLRHGRFDVIQGFAYPLPIRIIAEMLGIPVADQATFHRWSETLVAGPRTDARRGRSSAEERARTLVELNAYLNEQIGRRRLAPGQDLISRLLAAEVDGERLSDQELVDFCRLLLIAGYETTACQIGTAVLAAVEMPELAAALRADPALLPGAVEEIVRCFPSVAATVRVALSDVELGGQHIGRGQSLILWAGSANYDEAVFADPERFDPRRSPNRHLGFGHGPHFCLGAPLARLEVRLALGAFLQAFGQLRRDPAETLEAVDSPFLLGVKHLHLVA